MPDPEELQPTSIRFQHDELELLDAWCAYYSKDRGFKHSRSNLIRNLLAKIPPPAEKPGESAEAFNLRVAYGRVFNRTPKAEQ